ncbi:protein MMS22-like isoform X2 [Xenia sp. Carnegie-2017]|uniref:protein MMS22-like isoform X2 n=1 Tax=Xenia sp. Carnegie-2017 TaxID=2897299 RepID=UPI001F046A63|nr:protein MMS22-like isoform X2 [Xenia sp. Carnegie-2017]
MSTGDDLSDSGSITPPLIEVQRKWEECLVDEDGFAEEIYPQRRKDIDEYGAVPALHCCLAISIKSRDRLRGGFIYHGSLTRLLQKQATCNQDLLEKPRIKLFDFDYASGSALMQQRENLFYAFRQKVFECENQDNEQCFSRYIAQSGNTSWFYSNIREQCSHFFWYIDAFLNSHSTTMETFATFSKSLQKDLDSAWLFMGPVSDLPNGCFLKFDESNVEKRLSPSSHLLHLHLETKWCFIEILWKLYSLEGEPSTIQLHDIEEKTTDLLNDLIHIATHIHKGMVPSALLNTTPFLCACVKELWVLLIQTLDFISGKHEIKSFWSSLTLILNELILDETGVENIFHNGSSKISRKEALIFCWWLFVHIAPLYWYDVNGEYLIKEKANVSGNGIFLQDLLRQSFLTKDSHTVSEDLSRCYLSCCLKILQHWHPNNDVIILLWDYFHKKMNDMFYLPSQKIQTGACTRGTPASLWFEQMINRCNDPLICDDNDTSFDLFLRILSLHLRKLKNAGTVQIWKQLKGRFYTKFHKKRMEELSEQGMLNFSNIFLTLAVCVADTDDVINKMMSFVNLLDFKNLHYEKKLFIWKGYFVVMFLLKSKKINGAFIAGDVSRKFTDICRDFKEKYNDKNQRKHLWSLISTYMDCTLEILAYRSSESVGEHVLIGEGFSILLSCCSSSELMCLFIFTRDLLDTISVEVNDSWSYKEVCELSFEYIFPFIRKRLKDLNLEPQHLNELPNIFLKFISLSWKMSTASPSNTMKNLTRIHNSVRDFGLNDSIPSSFSCQFMASLMTSPEELELVLQSDYQLEVIHTWFRCSLQIPSQDQHLLTLTRIVFLKLPEASSFIKIQKSIVAGNVETAILSLVKGLGITFSSLDLLSETVKFREKALLVIGDFLKYIERFLKQDGPPDRLRLSYKVAACLVRHCAKIIYKKTQHDCLLPKIVDQLILLLHSKKPVPPATTQCIKLNLAEFIEGLTTLDFRRDEYIKRKIKQIFASYFHIFNQKCYLGTNSTPLNHPFLDVLKSSMSTDPSQNSSDFRLFVMNIIKENYLLIPGRTPQELTPTLFFLVDVFERTILPKETARNTPIILKNILACILACDMSSPGNEPPHIRCKATKILQLMLSSCERSPEITSRDELLLLLKEFISSNINQVQEKIFQVLASISKFDKELAVSTIPICKEAILSSERQRGVGADNRLSVYRGHSSWRVLGRLK